MTPTVTGSGRSSTATARIGPATAAGVAQARTRREAPGAPGSRRLVDAAAGRMRRILLTLPAFSVSTYGEALASAVAALPQHAALDILVTGDGADTVAGWLEGRSAPVNLVRAPARLACSHWVQDALLAAIRADGSPGLLISRRFRRYQDVEAAHRLAAGAGIPLEESDLAFEGGNVLACGTLLLMGADTVDQNGDDAQALAAALDPGRDPVVLGSAEPVATESTMWR